MYLRVPIAMVLALFASCKLPTSSGLKADMPQNTDAPLNAVINITYKGESYVSQSFIKSDTISVTECEAPESTEASEQKDKKDEKDESSDSKGKSPVVVQGYTFGYGKINDDNTKTSHILFIPESSGNGSSPLKPDTDYCVTVADVEDTKGKKIPGITEGFRFHTQANEEKERFFTFQRRLEKNHDFEGDDDDASSNLCSYSTIPLVGKKDSNQNHVLIESKALIGFYTSAAFNPSEISNGTSLCKETPNKQEMDSEECSGWSSVNKGQTYLVESFRKEKDGWIRAKFNTYAFVADYAEDTLYQWRIGVSEGSKKSPLPMCNNKIFKVESKEEDDSTAKDKRQEQADIFNKLFDTAGAEEEKIKDGERIFFIPTVKS